ncbi:hypothetical protein [Deinococcus navajonensis]|uniref:Uncharacterized protein n=1 Tax=Deinococcus navajonensis TaxID=309884 RepID=A0ABV8XJJ7_9DEIO
MSRVVSRVALVVWALYTFGPVLLLTLGVSIANWQGCRLDEGSVHPCPVLGVDLGSALYTMGMMGWVMLITVPSGLLVGALVGGAALLRRLMRGSGPRRR